MSDSQPTPSLDELTARVAELDRERLARRRAKLTHTKACDDGDEHGDPCDECVFLDRLEAAQDALQHAARAAAAARPGSPDDRRPGLHSAVRGSRKDEGLGTLPAQRQAIPVISTPATLTEAAQAFSASTKAALPKELTHACNADPSAPLEVPVVTAICSPPTVTVEPMTEPAPTAAEAVMGQVLALLGTLEHMLTDVTAKVAFVTRLEQFFGPLIADKQPPIDGALIATRAELDAAIERLARKHHQRLAALEQEVAELRGAGVVSRAARAARRALALVGGGK